MPNDRSARPLTPPPADPGRGAKPRPGQWHKRRRDGEFHLISAEPAWQPFTLAMRVIRAALLFAGRGDVRYYLNGVLIEPTDDGKAVYVVATDGHRLFAMRHGLIDVTLPPHQRKQMILSHDDLALIAKGEDGVSFDALEGGTTLRMRHVLIPSSKKKKIDSRQHLVRLIDGKYPLWQALMLKHGGALAELRKTVGDGAMVKADYGILNINPSYFLDCQKAAQTLSKQSLRSGVPAPVCAIPDERNKAFVVTFPLEKEAFALVMGLNLDNSAVITPDWLTSMLDAESFRKEAEAERLAAKA